MIARVKFRGLFFDALKYSVPVFLGYMAIGIAFGLLLVDAGYPWWLAPIMSVVMYAGAGQYIAVGLFAAGTTLWEAALVQLVVNARHMAYGLSLFNRFQNAGSYRYYLIYALSDETFALLSSLPEKGAGKTSPAGPEGGSGSRFMFYVALLDQSYWVAGSVIGAVAGSLIPFDFEGIGFALTALFIVLLIEQIRRFFAGRNLSRAEGGSPAAASSLLPRLAPFVFSAPAAILAVFFLPLRLSLLSALVLSLLLVQIFDGKFRGT
ncbi:MAG: AzlC family ABC transporter permease [Treponema sp.]|jgi:4-azaleucine resistance transporter AzlC|nr:AzlC family ABC transporter permease [Treponema sp.]